MAQLSEILTQEKHRINDVQMREIYLYAEGIERIYYKYRTSIL